MKTLIPILAILALALGSVARAGEEATALVRKLMVAGENFEDTQKTTLFAEVDSLLLADPSLAKSIESTPSRRSVDSAILWAAARNVRFDADTFHAQYPALAAYGRVIMLSPGAPLRQPRLIMHTPADGRGSHHVTMLYGSSKLPTEVTPETIHVWDDPYGVTDWISDFTLADTPQGPYLRSETIGRLTTGATVVRQILYWIRIEETRLVPERYEVYDVPPGESRGPQHLLATIRPSEPETPHPAQSASAKQRPPKEDAAARMAAATNAKPSTSLVPALKRDLDRLSWGAGLIFLLALLILIWKRRTARKRKPQDRS